MKYKYLTLENKAVCPNCSFSCTSSLENHEQIEFRHCNECGKDYAVKYQRIVVDTYICG